MKKLGQRLHNSNIQGFQGQFQAIRWTWFTLISRIWKSGQPWNDHQMMNLIRFNHLCVREICIVCHSSRAWRTIAIRWLLLKPTRAAKRCVVIDWALITAIWKFTKIQMISNINFIFWNTGLPMVRSFIFYINTTNNVNLLNNRILFQTALKIFSAFTKHRVPSFYSRNGTYSTTI